MATNNRLRIKYVLTRNTVIPLPRKVTELQVISGVYQEFT